MCLVCSRIYASVPTLLKSRAKKERNAVYANTIQYAILTVPERHLYLMHLIDAQCRVALSASLRCDSKWVPCLQ